jgi:signal transduction histidine kinase
MTPAAYALVGLTALVAGLVGVLVFALLRFVTSVREMRHQVREGSSERAFVAAALEDAIRKLREQERALTVRAESSERLNSEIVASLSSGLLVVGMNGDVRMLNPAGRRILRCELPAPFVPVKELLRDALPVSDLIEGSLRAGRAVPRQTVSVPRDGVAVMHLGISVSPLYDEHGATQGAVCLFTDLTDVVELEEQLRLKDSLARLGELTAGLAHEFRNGLATIHGYARLLDPAVLPPTYAAYVQALRDETDAVGRVVANFLAFARPVQMTLKPVEVGAVVERAVDDLRSEAERVNGRVTIRGAFAVVDGDDVLLGQALANLVRNALQACADAAIVPSVVVEGTLDRAQHLLRVTVSDNGPGVAPGLRTKIFQPFFTTRREGTGLGLALVQKIVVTHNGRIVYSATDDGGSAFTMVLPLVGHE